MLKSLETLSVRVDAHCDNAEKLVDFLNAHDKVGRVIYPGDKTHPQYDLACRQMTRGGNLIAFDVGADKADASVLPIICTLRRFRTILATPKH